MDHARLEGRVVGFPVGKELVLEMALSMSVKCTTPPNQVPLCTVKHLLDEAARIQFRKKRLAIHMGGDQFCSWSSRGGEVSSVPDAE